MQTKDPTAMQEPPAFPIISAIRAQRLYRRFLYGLAPAIVAAAITWSRSGDLVSGVLMLGAILLTDQILRAPHQPLHLVPLARYLLNALIPAVGVCIAVLAARFGDGEIGAATAVAAGTGAVLITPLAVWLDDRFVSDRPIRTAVIGSAAFAERLAGELDENGIRAYTIVGHAGERDAAYEHVRWLGQLAEVRSLVQDHGIDLLVVGPDNPRLQVFEETAKACLDLPVRMVEATALYEDVLGHVPIGAITSAWFQFIMHPRYSPSSPASKRALDLLVSGVLVTVLAPLMLACAVAVKLEDRGPILFRQRRVGEEGREFDMIKFRTMRTDADDLRDTHREAQLLTRVGRVLRKAHLNELPQLLQILRGEMSLVGPRPEPPELVASLRGLVPHYDRRALVKPGLTGWAQVRCGYAGSHFGTAWKTCHDLYYIKHRTARFDLLILLQTFHALVQNEGEEQMPAGDFILGEDSELVPR